MNQLTVPDSGITLVDGSIVLLARYPGTKWIVHNGWYTYKGQQCMGWYFCSIPAQTIVPVNDTDLRLLTLVSNEGTCECGCPSSPSTGGSSMTPPMYPVYPTPPVAPPPLHPHGPEFTEALSKELDRAFISVETIADRGLLQINGRILPNGKLVRVNFGTSGGPEYYRWNQATQTWEEENFAGAVSGEALTEEKAREIFATKEDLEDEVASQVEDQVESLVETEVEKRVEDEVEKQLKSAKEELADEVASTIESEVSKQVESEVSKQIESEVAKQVEDAVENNEAVKDAISDAATTAANSATADLSGRVETLEDEVADLKKSLDGEQNWSVLV